MTALHLILRVGAGRRLVLRILLAGTADPANRRHALVQSDETAIIGGVCVPKIRFGNIGGEVHREPAEK